MAKLLIYRGETRHAEVELDEGLARIGRSAQNEIVLEDPSKGVSRTHAEIRYEGGHYVLVDLESQNGIWVSGSRVSSVVLDPDVVASVGPFRLMVEAPIPAVPADAGGTPPKVTPPPERPTKPLPPDGPLVHDDQNQLPDTPAPRPRVPEAPRSRRWAGHPRTWLVGGAAGLLIVALGVAAYTLARKERPAFDLALARVMVGEGKCQQAVSDHINPALSANPTDAEALELKRQCDAPPPEPEPLPLPAQDTAAPLDEAEALIAGNECSTALDRISVVLADDPNNARAIELATRAKACIPPVNPGPAPRVATDALAVGDSPSQGGLDVLPKELAKDYQKRKLAMRRRYDEAVSMLQNEEYVQAAREFDAIAEQVPSEYLDLAQRRRDARKGVQQEALKSVDAAHEAEKAGDFDAAAEAYRRAHSLDPSVQIDAPMQRMEQQKLGRGRKRCEEARLAFSYGENAAAATAFQEVLKLLPPSEPCYALARDRLKQLGK